MAFVPRFAFSGAAIAALGCDEIVMAPEAIVGDAGEIVQGEDSQFRYVPEKLLSPLIEIVGTLADAKGARPPSAEAMVDMKLTVYRVRNLKTGKTAYKSQRESDADPGQWERLGAVPQTGGGRFFTVNGREAFKLGMAQGLAASRAESSPAIRSKASCWCWSPASSIPSCSSSIHPGSPACCWCWD